MYSFFFFLLPVMMNKDEYINTIKQSMKREYVLSKSVDVSVFNLHSISIAVQFFGK